MELSFWPLITIVAPIILVIALVWAIRNNRTSRRKEAETEAATKRMYDEQARDDGMNPEKND